MSNSIKVSPKYGVNPTIPVCFFCGEPKNEIALLGRVKEYDTRNTAYGTKSRKVINSDVKAPMHMVLDYEPCEHCKEMFSQGVLVIEVSHTSPDGRPPFQDEAYPTGRHVVVRKGVINIENDKCLMWSDEFEKMFGEVMKK